jgi:uncharacterized Zn finger protein (UPF0148 family)
MINTSKSNESLKKTMEDSKSFACPKCGYLLRERSGRCPNCHHQFQNYKVNQNQERSQERREDRIREVSQVLERDQDRKENEENQVSEENQDHRSSQDQERNNVEEHKGGNTMAMQRSSDESLSREYLNHLSNQLLEIEAKQDALEKLKNLIKRDQDEINNLMTSVKHQIRREEGLNNIDGIEPNASTNGKMYKAFIRYEEVENDEEPETKVGEAD